MSQSDYKKGDRYRVIRDGGQLHGMKPCGPGAQQGWAQPVPKGTVLTCNGVGKGWGSDSVPIVMWSDETGEWIANFAEFYPQEGGMWSLEPKAGYLEKLP